MTVISIEVGPFEVNCYLVSGGAGTAAVIDPGADPDRIEKALEARAWRLEAILLTHGHMDHVGGVIALRREHPVPVYIHPADGGWAFTERNVFPPYYPTAPGPAPADLRPLCAENAVEAAGLRFEVIETPGHTPGGVCLYLPDQRTLFSGDTLFSGAVGRTDLAGGNGQALAGSLAKLAALPGEIRVHPGHGRPTTIAEEVRTNPYLQ